MVNNSDLKAYLCGKTGEMPKNTRDSLIRYLKLTNNENDDKDAPENEPKLKRKKNKDVAEKMQSRRKVNRLKVMVTAPLIHLIDIAKANNPEANSKHVPNQEKEAKKCSQADLITRLSNGEATKEEFENLDAKTRKTLSKIVIPKGAKVGERAFEGCPEDMEILGTASEETKRIIREQIEAV